MSMREKIALSIAVSDGWKEPFNWHPLQEAVYYKRADAVLDALMEPTDEMISAGGVADEQSSEAAPEKAAIGIFHAMIRSAKDGE